MSYFEIGTALTANHAHASMMGVYGMLSAIAFAVFGLRYLVPENKWPEKGLKFSFWTPVIGLLWMSFISLRRWVSLSCTSPLVKATTRLVPSRSSTTALPP